MIWSYFDGPGILKSSGLDRMPVQWNVIRGFDLSVPRDVYVIILLRP